MAYSNDFIYIVIHFIKKAKLRVNKDCDLFVGGLKRLNVIYVTWYTVLL